LRACHAKEAARKVDTQSRLETLRLTALRESVGQVAGIEVARARSAVLESATLHMNATGQCALLKNALVALSGWSVEQLDAAFIPAFSAKRTQVIGAPPNSQLTVPAKVLMVHPAVRAALRTADAAYEELGQAQAARYPSFNLSALLGQSWIRVLGRSSNADAWSAGGSLLGSLFDGGAAKASAQAARARYTQAMAQLESTLRSSTQEIENALVNLGNAQSRDDLTRDGLSATQQLFSGSEASYRAGRMSLFELEDAHRSYNNAIIARIDAERDLAQTWVVLVKATGNALTY
jgi:outer membrane protein, multidrug efflux system